MTEKIDIHEVFTKYTGELDSRVVSAIINLYDNINSLIDEVNDLKKRVG